MSLSHYIIKRLIIAVPTLIGITLFIFLLYYIIGGLHSNFLVAYGSWLSSLFSGKSQIVNTNVYKGSISSAIALFLPNTLMLSIFAAVLIWFIGTYLGVFSARHKDSAADLTIKAASFYLYAAPIFIVAIVLIILFGVYLKILPFSGEINPLLMVGIAWFSDGISYPTHILLIDALIHGNFVIAWNAFLSLILPALSLALAFIAGVIIMLRNSMISVLNQNFITGARGKGLSERYIVRRHALRNAIFQPATFFAYTISGLLSGEVVIETIFNYPGMGYFLTQSLINNQLVAVLDSVLIFGIIFVSATILLDIFYAVIDPRVRF
ncbi:ABC transporter permease [Candidatus Parvarchaeota archaeon]|jgi:peptide/nickel transport system permease protein|nr:ABC transporter permease [Candidatus Acidifodinimicrobium mancum]MBE5729444.1 ABC transporter permease [Candidatus Acidifodinimicrobium mancum]